MDIERDSDNDRYVATEDEKVAGELAYEIDGSLLRLVHTEVDEGLEGKGVGSSLARRALDDARRDGRRVDPQCPFVAGFIQRHPEYEDLVRAG